MNGSGFRFSFLLPGFALGAGVGFCAAIWLPVENHSQSTKPESSLRAVSTEAITLLENENEDQPDVSDLTLKGGKEIDSKYEVDSSLPKTIAALQKSMRLQSTKGRLTYLALLQELSAEEAPRMLDVFNEMAQQGYKVSEYEPVFWERWAELDGEAVAATIFERDKRFKETNLSRLAISTWAKNDPNAAREWLFKQEDIPIREGMTKGLVEGIAIADPDLAQSFLESENLTSAQISHGFFQVARQKLIQEGIDSVGNWYSEISEEDPFFPVATNAAAEIYSKASFRDALTWANELEGSPDAVRAARHLLHSRLARKRPDGLLDFLGSEPNAPNLEGIEDLTSRAVERWLQTTPYAMGSWLQENENLPNYDLIVEPYVERIALEDINAGRAWAETIQNPERRSQVLDRISRAQ